MEYIDIYNDKNGKLRMEVFAIFNIKDHIDNYIIYNELDKSKYYIGKFKDNVDDLDTDLTDDELKLCNEVFERLNGKNE